MKIYFVRHGQTVANTNYTYCGVTDSPLSKAGEKLLEEKRKEGGYPDARGLDIYTSGLIRTEQTLRILFGDLPHSTEPDFAEMNFGVFEGHTYDELKDREDYQAWIGGDHVSNKCPGGESGTEVLQRNLRGVAKLLEKGRDALVVCHGGVIALLFYHYFPDTGLNWYEVQPKNGEGYIFEYEGEKAVRYEKIPRT